MVGFIGTCTSMAVERGSSGEQLAAYVTLEGLRILRYVANVAEVIFKGVKVHGGVAVALTGMVNDCGRVTYFFLSVHVDVDFKKDFQFREILQVDPGEG